MVNIAERKLTLQVTPLDIIDDNSAKEVTEKLQTNTKKLDVLVNNEGYLLLLDLQKNFLLKNSKNNFKPIFDVIGMIQKSNQKALLLKWI